MTRERSVKILISNLEPFGLSIWGPWEPPKRWDETYVWPLQPNGLFPPLTHFPIPDFISPRRGCNVSTQSTLREGSLTDLSEHITIVRESRSDYSVIHKSMFQRDSTTGNLTSNWIKDKLSGVWSDWGSYMTLLCGIRSIKIQGKRRKNVSFISVVRVSKVVEDHIRCKAHVQTNVVWLDVQSPGLQREAHEIRST